MPDIPKLYGAAAEFFVSEAKEVLLDSGARCGKSHAAMMKARIVAEMHPGSRQLFTRATRKSMTTTILPDFEQFVLGSNHPSIGRGRPKSRTEYVFPNGSVIDIIGCDDTQKILSGQWDRIYYFQAEEIATMMDWNRLLTRLSLKNTPYNQQVADVNPEAENNPMNIRGDQWICEGCGETYMPEPGEQVPLDGRCPACGISLQKLMQRIPFRLHDNPRWFDVYKCRDCGESSQESVDECVECGSRQLGDWTEDGREYMTTLNRLTGVQRSRLRDHKWVAATGLVLPEFTRERHMVHYETAKPDHHLRDETEDGMWRLRFEAWIATYDWGYRDAACLCFWGIKGRRIYRVWEAYFHEVQPDTFYGYLAQVDSEVGGLEDVIMSHERPEMIDKANQVLAERRQTREVSTCRATLWKGKDVGVMSVKRYLRGDGGNVYFCWDAHRWGIDQNLRRDGLPYSLEQEITSWVWLDPEKRRLKDKDQPDPDCEDHAMDNLQWAVLAHEDAGEAGFVPQRPKPVAVPGSYADVTGMFEVPLE